MTSPARIVDGPATGAAPVLAFKRHWADYYAVPPPPVARPGSGCVRPALKPSRRMRVSSLEDPTGDAWTRLLRIAGATAALVGVLTAASWYLHWTTFLQLRPS